MKPKLINKTFLIIVIFLMLIIGRIPSNALHAQNDMQSIETLIEYLEDRSHSLTDIESISPIISKVGDRRLVLLGESTHGTSEYYIWRRKISQQLIEEHDFNFIVVEGDWPSFYQINLYIKGHAHQDETALSLLREHFTRWPPWMWANEEVAVLIEWLKDHNEEREDEDKVGIYGMDIYSKEESISEVREYLRAQEDEQFSTIADLYNCFTPHAYDGGNYARAMYRGIEDCSEEVHEVVDFLRENRERLVQQDAGSFFNAKQNALIVKNAEKHYRTAIDRGPESWNHRVSHMEQTVNRLLEHYGQGSKGITWAHNTHIGDARATPMYNQGSYNIGQLARVHHGRENVFSVGFGCYKGMVLAGSSWGSERQTMSVPEAPETTMEYLLFRVPKTDYLLVFDDEDREHPLLNEVRGHRAIGVVYNPGQEYPGNYVPTIITLRYDAFIFIEVTEPLNPLH